MLMDPTARGVERLTTSSLSVRVDVVDTTMPVIIVAVSGGAPHT